MEECRESYALKEIIMGLRNNYRQNPKEIEILRTYDDHYLDKINIKETSLSKFIKLDSNLETYLTITPDSINFYIKQGNKEIVESLVVYNKETDLLEIKSFNRNLSNEIIVSILNIQFPMEDFKPYHIAAINISQIMDKNFILDTIEPCFSIEFRIQEDEKYISLSKIKKGDRS